jgi:hypothetical protein
MFLMIQNRGVAPEGSYSILGASSSRGVVGTIGQFGTGNKHAVNCCLREGLKVRARDWTLDWGALDWVCVGMGLREFVSNALDRSARNGSIQDAIDNGDLKVELTEKVQAKSGYTRVYVEASPDVLKYLSELHKRFLAFSVYPKGTLMPKAGRGIAGDGAMIYREGVFVRQVGLPSLYDYNFSAGDLDIDDCRNSSHYGVSSAVGKAIANASPEELVHILESLGRDEKTFESGLDSSYFSPSWHGPKDEQKEAWQKAWQMCFGNAILTDGTDVVGDFVTKKGHTPKFIAAEGWRTSLAAFGIKSHREVLSDNERLGYVPMPATAAAQKAVDQVWEWVQAANMDFGKQKPPVHCFKNIMNAGSTTFGYYEKGAVYLNSTIADECGKFTLKVALEEVAHYVTGANDTARDFQDFAFGFAVEFLA